MDGRSCLSKIRLIIKDLRESYEDNDEIPYEDVENRIMQLGGCQKRTIQQYFDLMERFEYLIPASKQVISDEKVVTVTHPMSGHIFYRRYRSSRIGFGKYRFGVRAARMVQTELKERPPSEINNQGSLAKENTRAIHTLEKDDDEQLVDRILEVSSRKQ